MSTIPADRRAWVERTLNHLRRQYAARALLCDGSTLSLQLLQKLYRMVIAEHSE